MFSTQSNLRSMPAQPYVDPDTFAELTFATPLKARFAVSEALRLPLGGRRTVSVGTVGDGNFMR